MKSSAYYLKNIMKTLLSACLGGLLGWLLSWWLNIPAWIPILIFAGTPQGWLTLREIFGVWLGCSPCGILEIVLFKFLGSVLTGWLILPVRLFLDFRDLFRSLKSEHNRKLSP